MRLTYAIKYVDDMDRAVAFYRDKLGLEPAFQSPFWSEFATGDTKLALHPASGDNKAGHVELGFEVDDVGQFHARRDELGIISASRRGRSTACTSPGSATAKADRFR